MNYISTRGDKTPRSFCDAVIEGLATDGGLLVPENLPDLSKDWPLWKGLPYPDIAFQLLAKLAPDIPSSTLKACCDAAYGDSYGGPVAPLVRVGDNFVLELIHGPTLAFKDVALQLLGQLFGFILERDQKELNIVAATSGDTGSAAIHGVKHIPRVKLFVTHPNGRIAPLQRRQMATVLEPGIFNIAVDGSFDDCQAMVKALSRDLEFKEKHHIGAVNSINFARIAAQVVYYFAAYLQTPEAHLGTPAVFAVPTGNFGNILAAEYARRMGLPIECLVLASNENDILPTFFNQGLYQRQEAKATHSPAMDIQIASNFERYLYLLLDQDGAKVKALMENFHNSGSLRLETIPSEGWRARSCSNQDTLKTAAKVWQEHEHLLDPHSSTAWWALQEFQDEFDPRHPRIVVATAHPAKFPDVLKTVLDDNTPGLQHSSLESLKDMEERLFHLEADADALKNFVKQGLSSDSEGVFLDLKEKAGRHG